MGATMGALNGEAGVDVRAGSRCCCRLMLDLLRGDVSEDKHLSITGMAEHLADVHSGDRAFPQDGGGLPGGKPAIRESTFCGALAAAVAVPYCMLERKDAEECHDEIMDWFCGCYGGCECEAVSSIPGFDRDDCCPKLIFSTYLHLRKRFDSVFLTHLAQKSVSY